MDMQEWGVTEVCSRTMEVTEEMRRLVRSELARESVRVRWARMNAEERKQAVRPANEARRKMGRKTGGRVKKEVEEERDELGALMEAMRN